MGVTKGMANQDGSNTAQCTFSLCVFDGEASESGERTQKSNCSTSAFSSPSSSIKIPHPSQCPRSTRYVLDITTVHPANATYIQPAKDAIDRHASGHSEKLIQGLRLWRRNAAWMSNANIFRIIADIHLHSLSVHCTRHKQPGKVAVVLSGRHAGKKVSIRTTTTIQHISTSFRVQIVPRQHHSTCPLETAPTT